MTESNAILELKAKNDKLKAELKRQKWLQNGRIQESIERKNVALDTLHMVWCSGGCGDIKVTAEMVAFVEEYAKRLRTWYINHADRIDPIVQGFAPPINHYLIGESAEKWNEAKHNAWQNAKDEIDTAREQYTEANDGNN